MDLSLSYAQRLHEDGHYGSGFVDGHERQAAQDEFDAMKAVRTKLRELQADLRLIKDQNGELSSDAGSMVDGIDDLIADHSLDFDDLKERLEA